MAISPNIKDREFQKFRDVSGETAVNVYDLSGAAGNPFAPPSNCDYISRSVLSNVETYLFKSGGSGGTLLKTIVITYTDATLESLVTVEVS
jgi:hypothetical protein